MNILPKKRWHVRNQDNKERVRRDEENARLEAQKEQDRIALAEKEARLSLLRQKKAIENSKADGNVDHHTVIKDHINLFANEEEAGNSGKKDNVDYMKEKKAERESYEKKIGLLKYVGQSSQEGKDDGKLWYTQKKPKIEKQDSDSDEVDQVKKSKLDPLMVVEKHMKKKTSKKEYKKKKKKDKEEKKSSSSKSIEQLREERLMREKLARQRTKELLNSKNGVTETSNDASIGSDRGKYFSQYNPAAARRKGNR